MGKNMRLVKIIILLTVFLATGPSLMALKHKGYQVDYLNKGNKEMLLDFNIDNYRIITTEKNGVIYSDLDFEGNIRTSRKGFASLPFIHANLALSGRRNVSIVAVDGDYKDYQLDHPFLPSRGSIYRNQNPAEIPFEIAAAADTDSFYPLQTAAHTQPFIFRDMRGINVYVYPFQYNAVENVLRVYSKVVVVFREDDSPSVNPLSTVKGRVARELNHLYSSMFVNYEEDKFANQIGERGDILLLYTSQNGGYDAIEPYLIWKREKGYSVSSLEVAVGTNVKTVIQDAYTANNNLLYVQLVGDWEHIKSDLGPDSAPVDPMLGCVSGSDLYPELIIGRFSANNEAEVTIQINKAIDYEKNPESGGSWYKNGIGIASNEGGGSTGDDGESDEAHMEIIRNNKLLPFTYGTVNQDYQTSGITASTVGNQINGGIGLINYTGHGSKSSWVTSGFSNANIASTTNGSMLPVIISVACVNGEFHTSGDCFAEGWLKKEGGGAAAVIMATINQPWNPPMSGQDYMNDILIGGYDYTAEPGNGSSTVAGDGRSTFGAVTFNGSVLMLAENYSDGDTQNTIKTWTIFGDASLQIRTDTPKPLSISSVEIPLGAPFETVITASGQPVTDALVSLSQNGNSYTGYCNAAGQVSISNSLQAGPAKLTVTAFNCMTIYEDVTVTSQDGPHLVLDGYSVSDTNNNQADFGETVALDLTIKNVGALVSSGIDLILTSSSSYVALIDDDSETVTSLAADGSVTLDSAFSVSFVNDLDDQTAVPFTLTMTDSYTRKQYETELFITVNAPTLEFSYTVSGNGSIQPGEIRELVYRVTNNGHAAATGLSTNLYQLSSLNISITDPVHALGTIAAGAYAEAVSTVSFGSEIASGSNATFRMDLSGDNEVSAIFEHSINIGMTESFESADLLANPWELGGDANWLIDGAAFDGLYCGRSGAIGGDQKSSMSLELFFASAGNIDFYRKVSSETGTTFYDGLVFYMDGVEVERWNGELDWNLSSYPVATGTHVFKWEYIKDSAVDGGSDCAWLDNILAVGAVIQGPPVFVCDQSSVDVVVQSGTTHPETLVVGNEGEKELVYNALITFDRAETVLFSEDFDSGFATNWNIVDGGSSSHSWECVESVGSENSSMNGTPFAVCNSDAAGSGVNMDEVMVCAGIDATSYATLFLEFDHYFNEYGYSLVEVGDVDVWDGSAWVNVYSTLAETGSWAGPDHQRIEITSLINNDLQVRFHYYNAEYEFYWAVDNVNLKGEFQPEGLWCTLDGSVTTAGTVTAASQDEIELGFNAAGLADGDYYAHVTFNHNGAGATAQVELKMTVQSGLVLPAPENVLVSSSVANVILSWGAVAGASGYKVCSSATPGAGFSEDVSGTFSDLSWTAASTGEQKFFYVIALDDRSESVSLLERSETGIKKNSKVTKNEDGAISKRRMVLPGR